MSTTVTQLGSSAENLSIGIANAVDWTSLSSALTSDNLHAFAQLQGLGSKSNYLYINDFNLNLPSTMTVEGISVLVQKKGTGTIEDYYVGLVYPSGEDLVITSPGRQLEGSWATSDTNYTYGSASELWHRTWTVAELNSSDFGFAISVEGNPANLDSGSVDYVEITVYYHNVFNEIPTGGVTLGGNPKITFNDFILPESAGCLLSGHGASDFTETTSGGVSGAGSANAYHTYGVFGGANLAGTASVSFKYTLNPSGGSLCNGAADRQVFYNPETSQGVLLNGNADYSSYYLVSGGLLSAGDSPVSATLFIYTLYIPPRGYGVLGSGFSFIDPYLPTGGILLNGSGSEKITIDITSTGGLICAGTSTIRKDVLTSGGILAAGDSIGGKTVDIPDWSLRFSKSAVVPPVTSSGDISATYADVWFNKTTRQISWKINLSGFTSGITGIAMHGPAYDGSNGSLVLDFGLIYTSGSAILTPTQKTQLLAGQYYIVIKTVDHPSGEARSQIKSPGITIAGTAFVKPYIEIVSGGITLSGTAAIYPWIATGGAKLSGSATLNNHYAPTLSSEEYSLIASATNSVPTDNNPYLAFIYLRLNATTRLLSWKVEHNLPGIDAIRIRGPANRTSTAGTIVSIDARSGTTSPSIGSVTLGEDEVSLIQSGLTYITLYDNDADEVIRVQIIKNDAYLSGTASVSLINSRSVSGGAVAAGLSIHGIRWSFTTSGGVIFGGEVTTAIFEKGKGGATVGSAALDVIEVNLTTVGGSTVGASGITSMTYTHTVGGGVVCAGFNPTALTVPVSGGANLGGIWAFQYIPTPPIGGGAIVAPSYLLTQTYAASGIGNRGGVYAGGRGRTEKIKFFVNRRLGYGRAMASTNILSVISDTRERIMDANASLVPILDENDFKIRHVSKWCDVSENCSGVLPKIIQNRQKGILPSKG